MKIMFLVRSLDCGGAERQLVELSRGLHRKGYSVFVGEFYAGGRLEEDLIHAGVPVKPLNKRGRWDMICFMARLIRLVRREDPEIIHGYGSVPNLLAILLKLFSRRAKVVWGIRSSFMDFTRYDWLSRFAFRVQCLLSRFSDLCIVNSMAGRIHHEEWGFPSQKMAVVPNGIDTGYFRPVPDGGRRFREEWGGSDGDIMIGLVGRLDLMKDHPTFLRAAAQLVKQRNDLRFVCVGGGPQAYRNQLEKLTRELDLEKFLVWCGEQSDMPAVYSSLDIAVSSSYGEGFPNVICEAMACGVPCVVTDVGDSAWIVGQMGVVVPARDSKALASGIESLLRILPGMDRSAIQREIDRRFNVNAMVERTESLIQDLNADLFHHRLSRHV